MLLNQLFPGLVLGAQAIEKFLKAYILLADPKKNVRKLSHSLSKLLEEANQLTPNAELLNFRSVVVKFTGHYETRYPDNPRASTSMTTADINELDQLVIFLNENLPCPMNVRYRSGLYAAITFSLSPSATVTPTEHWIKLRNAALIPLMPRITQDYAAVMISLYA